MVGSHVGVDLFNRGWRQGSLFNDASARMAWLTLHSDAMDTSPRARSSRGGDATDIWHLQADVLAADDHLVVVTQTCDLSRSPDAEPYVEVVRAYWTSNQQAIHEASWNSIRRFLLQRRASDGSLAGLIADATVRIQIEKAALLAISPRVGVDEQDAITYGRFRRWLAQRYGRRPIDVPLVRAVQGPVVEGIRKLRAGNPLRQTIDSIREVRYVLQNDDVPYQVEMWFIPELEGPGVEPLDAESAAAFAGQVADWLEKRGEAVLVHWGTYELSQISALDYLTAYPLPLEHYSQLEDPDEPMRAT